MSWRNTTCYYNRMWKDPLVKVSPDQQQYYNTQRSYNGAWAYSTPGVLYTLPAFESGFECIDTTSSGDLQHVHTCRHYRRAIVPTMHWALAPRQWYNATHVYPNPGYWNPTHPLPVSWHWDLVSGGTSTVNAKGAYGPWDLPLTGLPVLISQVAGVGWMINPFLDDTSRNLLIQQSLSAMLPQIKSNLSLLNSIYELKDMRTVVRTILRLESALNSLQLKKLLAVGGVKMTLSSIVKSASDLYLQKQFNLNPLVNDIFGLKTALVSLRRELESLRRRANVPQKRHFTAEIKDKCIDVYSVQNGLLDPVWVDRAVSVSRSVRYDVRKFYATIEYSYTIPSMTDAELSIRGMLDKLGVNLNPSIIWNAIPWSFVVDWFFGVSRWLDQFQTRNIEPLILIRNFCHTTHVQRVTTTSLVHAGYAGVVNTVQEEAYDRKAGLNQAVFASSIKTSGLNLKEFSLSAALLLSR